MKRKSKQKSAQDCFEKPVRKPFCFGTVSVAEWHADFGLLPVSCVHKARVLFNEKARGVKLLDVTYVLVYFPAARTVEARTSVDYQDVIEIGDVVV